MTQNNEYDPYAPHIVAANGGYPKFKSVVTNADKLSTLAAVAEQAVEALKEVEWSGYDPAYAQTECPSCEAPYGQEHFDGCKLTSAISALRAALKLAKEG